MDAHTKPVIIGSLTAKESSTLTILLKDGLGKKPNVQQTPASASVGSQDQIPRVEAEMTMQQTRPTTHSTSSKCWPEKDSTKLPEVRILVKQLSSQELECFRNPEQNLFTLDEE